MPGLTWAGLVAEVGIDIAAHVPLRWTDSQLTEADVVIAMGCGDTCPYVPGTRYDDWPIPDPAGLALPDVRPIRDHIRDRVETLLHDFGTDRRWPDAPATPKCLLESSGGCCG